MAENETISAIDVESKLMLEEHVKKGKPRKFILICKGASIKTLIVFKKGPYGVKINQAKKSGFRGEAYCGVITGKGANVSLQLPGNAAVSDAMGTEGNVYNEEPCKVAKLREFFVEQAGLKFHPEFSIVTAKEQVVSVSESDDEESSAAAGSDAPSQPPAAAAAPSAPSQDQAELKRKLFDGMKQLLPRVQQAIQAQPERREELLGLASKFNSHLKNNELDTAKALLVDYAKLLQRLAGSPGPAADGAGDWDARVARLTPRLKQVLGQKLGDFAQVAALFKQAREAQAANPQAALELLTKCEQLVDEALGSGQAAAASGADDKAFMTAWAEAEKDWLEAVETADSQIAKLQAALSKSGDDELEEIAEFGLPAVTGNLKVPLMAAMRDLSGGQAAARKKSIEKLRGLTEQFSKHLNSDARVAAVDENEFGVRVTLRETLGGALDKMHAVLSRS